MGVARRVRPPMASVCNGVYSNALMRAGVIGSTGYLGAELLRLLANHPSLEVAVVQGASSGGERLERLLPGLAAGYPGLVVAALDPDALAGLDVGFVAVPSGASQEIVTALYGRVGVIVDLGADFRLKDETAYKEWYGFDHGCPHLLEEAVYGLPELYRDRIAGAGLVAAPGCYVTAAALSLHPFVAGGLVEARGIVVDAASGTSGAGKSPRDDLHHPLANERFSAYGLLTHRHTPEMQQVLGAELLFTPHLAPMTRGILSTSYARPTAAGPRSTDEVLQVLAEAYSGETFVRVTEEVVSTSDAYGCNVAHLTGRYDARTGWIVLLCAIDNLVKGGAGQALQAANVALGLPEASGLPTTALAP